MIQKSLAEQFYRWRSAILATTLLVAVASLAALPSLYFSNDFRVYFSEKNPQLAAFEKFEAEFSSHDSIAFIIQSDGNSWFNNRYLTALNQATEAAWKLPGVTRVNSLANYQYTYAIGDEINTVRFSDYSKDIEQRRNAHQRDPQLYLSYLSEDESVAVIQVDLAFDKSDKQQIKNIYQQADAFRHHWLTQFQQVGLNVEQFYLVGSVVSNVTLEQAVKDDLILLVPLSYLIITLGLLYFLRSIKATLLTLIVVTLSIIFTFSIFALFKQELTPVAGFVPSVILTLAVADCVHYLTSYRFAIEQEHKTEKAANKSAFEINFSPITLTSITTAIGVLFLNLSDSPPYQDLGNMVAIGVLLAWLLSLTLLPIALNRFPIHYQVPSSRRSWQLDRFCRSILRARKTTLLVGVIFCSILTMGISQLTVSENWSKYFSQKFELANAIKLLDVKFDRLHRYELVFDSQQPDGINTPEYLTDLEALLSFLETHNNVKHIQSYGYVLKHLNRVLHQDNADYFVMPDSQPLAAQYLLLYELSLPEGLGLNSLINHQRSASRISILLQPMDSQELLTFEQDILKFFSSYRSQPEYQLSLSGMDNIFAHIAHRNINQMLIGSLSALLVICGLIALVLRSLKYGLISLLPNLLPGAIAYGIWGFSFGYIDLALSVVICMSLGIVVDDTVHFLSKYAYAKRQLGLTTEKSLEYSFNVVGRALITTTVILVCGFATLIASPLNPTAATGALLCITLLVALLVDFLLLPLTLYFSEPKSK
ncbi:MAG: MMPL family transporter [Gammaproteobacteria bacterium]|nr:MMPL family transporter [Gammaproteobacteria bacterium]